MLKDLMDKYNPENKTDIITLLDKSLDLNHGYKLFVKHF